MIIISLKCISDLLQKFMEAIVYFLVYSPIRCTFTCMKFGPLDWENYIYNYLTTLLIQNWNFILSHNQKWGAAIKFYTIHSDQVHIP